MQKFPTLKTTLPNLELQPFQSKHLSFVVSLLSDTEIQKTLFRVPTKITMERERKSLERMYESEPSKEITYIVLVKTLLAEKPIGYVKIKLVDWNVKSCYVSIAILPDGEYRGKGYATASYNAFFEYLFSLGLLKIYSRTNETNFASIRLNEATGFTLVGRQSDFVIYPNMTSQDDLLFERLSPKLAEQYTNSLAQLTEPLSEIFSKLGQARIRNDITPELIETTLAILSKIDQGIYPLPVKLFIQEIQTSLTKELADNNSTSPIAIDSEIHAIIQKLLAGNAESQNLVFLAYPITKEQFGFSMRYCEQLVALATNDAGSIAQMIATETIENANKYGCYTPENWEFLRTLFLGKKITNSTMSIIRAIQEYLRKKLSR